MATVVHAVSYINFANRCNAPHAETLAEECLGKGILLLSKMIGDKKLAASNEALCSVYLMGVYEVSTEEVLILSANTIILEFDHSATQRHIFGAPAWCKCTFAASVD